MLCLRCGGCCLHLDIFIVNPLSILSDGSIDPNDQETMIFKPAGKGCPHLAFKTASQAAFEAVFQDGCKNDREGDYAVCTIHHLPCYQATPCQQFEQVGPRDAVCIMSGYFKSQMPELGDGAAQGDAKETQKA